MELVSEDKRSLFNSWASEFEQSYLRQPKGQRHLEAYKMEREQVIRFWEEIKKAKEEGKNITNMVLTKLLPYCNNQHNRDMGYRIICLVPLSRPQNDQN